MKERKELNRIVSPKRIADVLWVSYDYARQVLSWDIKKHQKAIINDLIIRLDSFVTDLKTTKKGF